MKSEICPKCSNRLVTIRDLSTYKDRVCPNCFYYDSDSEAYRKFPELFTNLGPSVLKRLKSEGEAHGLTAKEAWAWFQREPDFTKRIVTPLGNNSHQTRRYQNLMISSD